MANSDRHNNMEMVVLKLDGFKGRDLQSFEALMATFLAQGITDIRLIQEHIHNHFTAQRKAGRLSMSPEARKQAREKKRIALKRLKGDKPQSTATPNPTTDTCPDCGKKDWRVNGERQSDGSIWWYEGCAKCGFIQPIGDR